MSTVIKVENLSKRYFLSHKSRERFPTFRDAIVRTASNMGKRLLHPLSASSGQPLVGLDSTEEFWALDDLSFEVKQGDRVGIIGRNGAGKSTLLKILSRITEPTKGRVSIKGRVASLLEVGTGFHPELSGRENIFLNGAILGMSKFDIKRRFDEIVAFAEVDRFLDTPVKRYSSGMYVRLAFAVAAHLEPEILVVDEVLAVGDMAFQNKCLSKMQNVADSGRTILFVSHNMTAVLNLCSRTLLLEQGKIVCDGAEHEVVQRYLESDQSSNAVEITKIPREDGHGQSIRIVNVQLLDDNQQHVDNLKFNQPFYVKVAVESLSERKIESMSLIFGVDSAGDHARLASCSSEEKGAQFDLSPHERVELLLKFEQPLLAPGRYAFTVVVRKSVAQVLDRVPQCLYFDVMDVGYDQNTLKSFLAGSFRLDPSWDIDRRV